MCVCACVCVMVCHGLSACVSSCIYGIRIFLDASACLDIWTHGCLPECVHVRSCSCGCTQDFWV